MAGKAGNQRISLEWRRSLFLCFLKKYDNRIIRLIFNSRKDYDEKIRDTDSKLYVLYKHYHERIVDKRDEAMKLGVSMSEFDRILWS